MTDWGNSRVRNVPGKYLIYGVPYTPYNLDPRTNFLAAERMFGELHGFYDTHKYLIYGAPNAPYNFDTLALFDSRQTFCGILGFAMYPIKYLI